MTDPSSEEDGLLREWAPLTGLLQQIPLKAQRGLFTHELNLTCVDTLPEFIAVGTNLGLVYWYNRKKGDLQRLRCENTGSAITCVKVISTVDFMVAAGNDQGIVTVFQIPKIPPDNLPESMKPKKNKQVERYTISGLHTSPVTAIEWSMNGMKLFSGDKNGLVVLTEIDFYMHLSKSVELLNEKYEIVQLSYSQQLLLVSTLYRSIVCCHREDRWKVAQVGQKERKTLGRLGATFCLGSGRPQELVVYSSRPGLRVWLADKNGIVQQTLIYKDALMSEHTRTPLINPAPSHIRQSRGDHQFGPLLVFRENLLVTYSSDVVYVLNPATIAVMATVADLRKVQDVAVNKDEIFILEGERSLVRIAYAPENTATVTQENHEVISMNLDTTSTTEVLIHIVGSSEVQSMLENKSIPKRTVWDHVASEMKKIGFNVGENGGKRCRQKWINIIRNYHHFIRTRTFSSKAQRLSYYDKLQEILDKRKQNFKCSDISEELSTDVLDHEVVSGRFKSRQDCESEFNNISQYLTSPQYRYAIGPSGLSSSDVPTSSDSCEEGEGFKTLPENCSVNSSISEDDCIPKLLPDQSNEEIILVYPEGTSYTVNTKSLQQSEFPVEHSYEDELITVYPDEVGNLIFGSVANHFMDHSYTDELLTEYQKQSSQSSFSVQTEDITNSNNGCETIKNLASVSMQDEESYEDSYSLLINSEEVASINSSSAKLCDSAENAVDMKSVKSIRGNYSLSCNPTSDDIFTTIKSENGVKNSKKNSQGPTTVVISPKLNQPARPVPTAGEAMMMLVLRLHKEDRRREIAREKRTEARIQSLETLLEQQTLIQQELNSKALSVLKELK